MTNRTIVPAMSALPTPAVTPINPVFSDDARESEFAHQKTTLPMSPTMFMMTKKMRILWIMLGWFGCHSLFFVCFLI
jgi:hypothetical protein